MDNSERGKFRRRRLLLYLWEWWAWVWLWCKGGECGIIVAMWMEDWKSFDLSRGKLRKNLDWKKKNRKIECKIDVCLR